MKAITVYQPRATLIALGIKTIETKPSPPNGNMRPDGVRGLPGLAINRGERIAIHAAAKRPSPQHEVHWGSRDDSSPLVEANESPWIWTEWSDGTGGSWTWWAGPLGAVVATAVVADALPIIAEERGWHLDLETPYAALLATRHGQLLQVREDVFVDDIHWTSQLPLGDFTPGRWGWLLTDVEPLPEPIPARGKQGVWEWTP